MKFLIGVFDT